MWLYLQFVTNCCIYGSNKQLIIIRWSDWVMRVWREKDLSKEIVSPNRSACKPHLNVVEVISTSLTSTHHVHWQHKQKTSSFLFDSTWEWPCTAWFTSPSRGWSGGMQIIRLGKSSDAVCFSYSPFRLLTQHNIPSRDVMPSSQQPMRGTSRKQNGRAVCECLDLSSGINQTGISPWGGDLIVCTDSRPYTLHTSAEFTV